MLTMYARNWRALALRGALAITFGIVALVLPRETLLILAFLFGVYALTDGLLALVQGIHQRQRDECWRTVALEGTVGIVVGLLTFIHPVTTTFDLSLWIGRWAVITGLLEIVAAIQLRRVIASEQLMLLTGILSFVFGVQMIVFPRMENLSVAWLIGGYAITVGILFTMLACRLHKLLASAWIAFKNGFRAI